MDNKELKINKMSIGNGANVILYCRVCVEKQGNEKQKKQLLEYCKEHGYNVIDIVERVTSGTKVDEQLKNCIYQHEGVANKLLFVSWDRLTRNPVEAVSMIKLMLGLGIEPVAIEEYNNPPLISYSDFIKYIVSA